MSFLDIVQGLKTLGGGLAKGLVIEGYIAYYENDLIEHLRRILNKAKITADDIPEFVQNNRALPIPREAFGQLKGLEDYIETMDPKRLYKWLTLARPDLGLALAALDDEGAEYMARLRYFFVDSIRTAPLPKEGSPPPKEKPTPSLPEGDQSPPDTDVSEQLPDREQKFSVTCNECGNTFFLTKEQIANLKECPECGEPANLQL